MRPAGATALAFLVLVGTASLLADFVAPRSYAEQSRDQLSAPPSARFWLGTDELGRDRFSRLVHGTRISLLLAPAAALLSTACAAILGGSAGYLGGGWERCFRTVTGFFLSLPWLFLLLTVRALLPLNVSPVVSVVITFLLLGGLGSAMPARIIHAAARNLIQSDYLLQARAQGHSGLRLFSRHLIPNLRPILFAQFWISVPVFILSEANLGLLGLGVTEPLPSWGPCFANWKTTKLLRTVRGSWFRWYCS
ncbi:MAG: ABC transporter permease subunit [Acidobacteriota bacterium]|nr:ABC transporter permease subunit [Acidobacteriota bacterium]